jgi:alanine dehydrogenase
VVGQPRLLFWSELDEKQTLFTYLYLKSNPNLNQKQKNAKIEAKKLHN